MDTPYVCGRAPCLFPNCDCAPKLELVRERSTKTGWRCPVCGCGNAPFAMKCGHCVPSIVGPSFEVKPCLTLTPRAHR